jgi:geranylgeranyl diphosphate synthase type I
MYALARLEMMGLESSGLPPEAIVEALAMLDRACLRVTESLYTEIASEGTAARTADAYLQLLPGKAALYGCACALGATTAAGGNQKVTASLRGFGEHLGIAAMIRDEAGAVWGAQSQLIELLDKRRSLPVLAAFQMATGEGRAALEAIASREEPLSDERVAKALGIMEEAGARHFCEEQAGRHMQEALALLRGAGLPAGARREMEEMTHFLAGDR